MTVINGAKGAASATRAAEDAGRMARVAGVRAGGFTREDEAVDDAVHRDAAGDSWRPGRCVVSAEVDRRAAAATGHRLQHRATR